MRTQKRSRLLYTNPGLIFEARKIDLHRFPKVDGHIHTNWTDGVPTINQVYEQAQHIGLSAILYSEHSRSTSADWFPDFAREISRLPPSLCKPYVGTEVKIKSWDGSIDTTDEIRECCDFLMASVHRLISSNDEVMEFSRTDPTIAVQVEYELSIAALENAEFDILGHMFGMSLSRFKQDIPDILYKNLIKKAAECDVAIEINSQYHKNMMNIFSWCEEFDCLVSFGSNAHDIDRIGEVCCLMKREFEL